MDGGFALWLFAVSLGASALGGTLGMASGIFIVPILTMFGHVELRTAVGASLVSVIACSSGGAAQYLRGGFTNVRLALVLETTTTLGALTGVLLAGFVPIPVLYGLFAAVLLVSAQQMTSRRTEHAGDDAAPPKPSFVGSLGLDASYSDAALGRDVPYRVQRLPLGMALMYAAGLLSALLGIGSGVLKIPAMDTALRLPIKVSSGTSNFMIGVTAAASAGAYYLRGEVSPAVAGPVALGSVVGAMIGARVLLRTSSARLRWLFVVVLVLLGVRMLLEALGVHLLGASS
ncbi:MAG TPA: sulfite exporter TauE/SafE family protein [Byssovorax sp.]